MSATSDAPSAPAAAAVEALVEALQLLDLSADALGHVLFRLPDAEDIARAAPACKAFSAAAQHATKLRADALPFPLQRAKGEPALRAVRSAEAALRPVHTIAASNFHSHVIGQAGTSAWQSLRQLAGAMSVTCHKYAMRCREQGKRTPPVASAYA